jgi:hypothetical protein
MATRSAMSTYATRFPGHLRSLVLDAPWGEPYFDPFARAADGAHRVVTRIGLLCDRSPACARSSDDAIDAVRRLVRRVRRDSVTGTGLDADGGTHDVTIDTTYLVVHIIDGVGDPNTLSYYLSSEIPAAGDALARGDAVPLLRLAAESDFPIPRLRRPRGVLAGRELRDFLRRPAVAVVAGRPARRAPGAVGRRGPRRTRRPVRAVQRG